MAGAGVQEDEVVQEFHFLRHYKSGRVERLKGTEVSPAGIHLATAVSSKDVPIDPFVGIYARLYLPPSAGAGKLPVVVYFHGGGFCFESAFSPTYHVHMNDLAARAQALVVSVNYRLAPEFPLPAGYDDCWAALAWVASAADPWIAGHGDLGRVFLAGDSAGANIVHHLAMRVRGGTWPEGLGVKGMVMVHPFFWGKEAVGKEAATAEQRKGTEKMWSFICPASPGIDDPWINPLAEERLREGLGAACKRMLVCVGEKDFLRERGVAYHDAVAGSGWGGDVELLESAGEGHVFHLFHPERPTAVDMLQRIVDFINAP